MKQLTRQLITILLPVILFLLWGCGLVEEAATPPEEVAAPAAAPPRRDARWLLEQLASEDGPAQIRMIMVTPEFGEEEWLKVRQGEDLYEENCAPCHFSNGEGNMGIFPALNGNQFVTLEDPAPAIDTVLHGRDLMPSFQGRLTDQEVAAVLSYVRNAWNNNASTVTVEQVNAVEEMNSTAQQDN